MKKTLLISFLITNLSYAKESTRPCVQSEKYPELSRVAKEVSAACGWMIEDVVKKWIVKDCQEKYSTAVSNSEKGGMVASTVDPDHLSIVITSGKIEFNENANDYCHSKTAYDKLVKFKVDSFMAEVARVDKYQTAATSREQEEQRNKAEAEARAAERDRKALQQAKEYGEYLARNAELAEKNKPAETTATIATPPTQIKWKCFTNAYVKTAVVIGNDTKASDEEAGTNKYYNCVRAN